ncbi:hypothetical protein ACRE_059690 [Hapsidospora chrysogenum ATCC 11550]|uniref:Uncharacterized protein n=1 Tax=Hapsidospora chrysogenum (strain ATCC 11550 / CBS 779.69 / DSM 880 / IAM 14645 / JCM 23072 / IMI 49137) TaxID=857340 RepID=A0A086T1M5_HAPC1|nr:hypothetical protein ACRE_059690 [Hapsidospora chrysogenum ATCC 11550]
MRGDLAVREVDDDDGDDDDGDDDDGDDHGLRLLPVGGWMGVINQINLLKVAGFIANMLSLWWPSKLATGGLLSMTISP